MEYMIGEFSDITGLSIHTLRYYESENLLAPERKDNGRRIYSERDVSWVAFILRLKETNMPIKQIKEYAMLRAKGNTTLQERRNLLHEHRAKLYKSIECMQAHLRKLDDKIQYYDDEIKKL